MVKNFNNVVRKREERNTLCIECIKDYLYIEYGLEVSCINQYFDQLTLTNITNKL